MMRIIETVLPMCNRRILDSANKFDSSSLIHNILLSGARLRVDSASSAAYDST